MGMLPSSAAAAAFVQLGREPVVQQVVLLYSALAVAVFHEHRRGTSPVRAGAAVAAGGGGSQQQQQQGRQLLVPPFHKQLLQALGVADVVLTGKWDGCDKFRRRVASSLGPAGSSGSGGCAYVDSAMGAVEIVCGNAPATQHLACPALLLLVEAACLAPDSRPIEAGLSPCFVLLTRPRDAAGIAGLPVVPQQQLLTVLQAVLTLLLPTVRHIVEQRGSDADTTGCRRLLAMLAMQATGLALDAAGAAGADETSAALPLADLMLQHTSDYCGLLEASVRLMLSNQDVPVLLSADAATQLATAVRSRGSAQLAALLADEAAGLQLFALAVSCIKGLQLPRANSDQPAVSCAAASCAAACLRQLRSFAVAAAPLTPRSTRLLALLTGRCLVALRKVAAEESGGQSVQQRVLADVSGLLAWAVEAVLPDADAWVAVSGPAAAADPAARLQLLEATRQLQQQLDAPSTAWDETAASATAAGHEPPGWQAIAATVDVPLAQQLEAFGAALCAQLPGRFCCNNHGCSNLATASELQLVAGGQCSGCKTARYCSAACQKAHWKGWHKPMCERIQQQREAAASKRKSQQK